jgi:hypothetical protein
MNDYKMLEKVGKNPKTFTSSREDAEDSILEKILNQLPKQPRTFDMADDPGFWVSGRMILCPSEAECSILAGFLDMLEGIPFKMGYFDPFDPSEEKDDFTGFYYIDFQK